MTGRPEGAVPDEGRKQAAHRALVNGVLHGAGQAAAELRARAFSNTDLPSPLQALIGKVVASPADITDADFAAATASGFSDDQLFELVVAAAVGHSARLYDAGLAALAEAAVPGEPDNAA
jgi:alkylhydroperoxidase family enzyme